MKKTATSFANTQDSKPRSGLTASISELQDPPLGSALLELLMNLELGG